LISVVDIENFFWKLHKLLSRPWKQWKALNGFATRGNRDFIITASCKISKYFLHLYEVEFRIAKINKCLEEHN